ncbi:MAG: C10 family peptidase [Bacteroidota bacterium]|nr:C10 family peptidase [Bacteroidota bacterium]
MRKMYFLTGIIGVFLMNSVFGGEVPQSKAKQVAINYYNHLSHTRTSATVTETLQFEENDQIVYYVFNFSSGGYMIISAEDEVRPVLSYSFKGHFVKDDPRLPDNYAWFLNKYKEQILIVKNRKLKGNNDIRAMWDNYYSNTFTHSKEFRDVSPLLDTEGIAWDQGCYYNADCPADANGPCGHVVTGCVATAMAQIMRYHSWPDQGTGSHTYTDQNYGEQSADFGAATYDWASMPGSVTSSNAEVAEIMYHCGVAVEMSYNPGGSGAQVYGYVKEGFVNYFNYDDEALYGYRENYTDDSWKNLLYADLDNGLPVFYSGSDEGGTYGHAFVCDGYQGTDEFHFNWGWSGAYNSYNTIDDLTSGQGDFSYNNQAVFHVHPSYGLTSVFSGSPTALYVDNTVSFTDGSYGAPNSWSWQFGDGGTSTEENPSHTYTTTGLFDVTLEVSNGTDTDTQTKTDYIKVVPTDAGFSMDFEDCVDYSNDFFPWSVVDGDQLNTYGSNDCDYPGETDPMAFMAFNPADAGLTLASAHGGERVGMAICPADGTQSDDWLISEHLQLGTSSSLSIWVLSPKPGTWGNNSYEVLISTSGNAPADFSVISGASPVEAPDTWTQHTYDLSDYDDESIYLAIHEVSTDMFMFWIDDMVISTDGGATSLSADFFADNTSIAVGETVNFTDNSTGTPTSWSWSFGDGGTASTENPAHTYNTEGVYTVEMTVSDGTSSDTETKTDYITVTSEPLGGWIEQASGFTTASRGIFYISIVDANTAWAIGYDGTGGGANVQEFTKTSNGGDTWTPGTIDLGDTDLGIAMITAISETTAWIVAYPTGAGQTGGIWKTTDGGSNWTRQNSASYSDASSFSNVVYFWDENNGFCQGDPINGDFELYTTTDGGSNWTLVPGANIPDPLSGEYGYTSQIEVVGDDVWFTTNNGRIYHSSDKGYNWEVFDSPINDFGSETESGNISFKNSSTGILVDNNANVYKTTNSGANWTQLTTIGTVFPLGLCWVEGTDIVFTTGAAEGNSGSSYSEDGGTTWSTIDSQQHLYVDFLDENTGYSGWFNTDATTGGMWKWEPTVTSVPQVKDKENSFTVYPNPTEGTVRLTGIKEKTSVKLYNITGRLLTEKEVYNDCTLDLSNFSTGIYLIELNNQSHREVIKVEKLK